MKAFITILIYLLLSHLSLQGQIKDTLTTEEKGALELAWRNSSFGQIILTGRCSRAGDSIGAGQHLLQVDPYYLMREQLTPANIDSFITARYSVPATVKKAYADSFIKIYNKPKSTAYAMFEKMHDEDQAIRWQLDSCTDSLSCSVASEQMQTTDSVHFAYLLRYVHKYGWPTMANGSINASVIALHDHRHHILYGPMIVQAALKGSVDIQVVNLMYHYLSQRSFYITLSKHKYVVFDVTAMLNGKIPANLAEIDKVIAAHCPVMWYWQIEWSKYTTRKQANIEVYMGSYGRMIQACQRDMVNYNCNWDLHHINAVQANLWEVSSPITTNDTSRMLVYLAYGPEIQYNDLDILFADTAFATHAIFFDNNKPDIKRDSYVFLNELVQWLKSKPAINIQITGHTDNVGKPADNLKLSLARAGKVKEYLVAEGIDAARVSLKGMGDKQPIETNTTDEGCAQNRRVEFRKL